ncbi:glutathione S-transferase [Roseobacter sinensis]|uniref:Glutathione S-transferase n=1 Tax=Roseobacter sinensis TaxID=2931391 RepID=A0ABT3BCX1_9RHOB|nr:glutathione S-transferase [Roseobacter sp. WL0113]MCV3271425.1 glutathione S-transferase [Roseobacter sp. WL0113]
MTYDLYIGDRLFSSWSLRGWLMLEKFALPHRTHLVGLYSGTMADDLAPLAPARLVPVLKTPEGEIIGETLAMAETLAERHPEAGLWPKPPALRSRARWLCAEMASGFSALRETCPMQLHHVNQRFEVSPALAADLTRLQEVWASARAMSGATEGWIMGSYSLVDVFFAPVAARIIGYDLPVSAQNRAYCVQTIEDPAFRAWRAEALKVTYDPFPYPTNCTLADWPAETRGD